MKHTRSKKCLKLIKVLDNENNENNVLLNKMIEFQKSRFEKKPKKRMKLLGFLLIQTRYLKKEYLLVII